MQPPGEYTIYRKSGSPRHSCKACGARLVGQDYKANIPARIQNSQRASVRSAELAQGVHPFRSLWRYVGCSWTFLVSYIEAMLPPGWDWGNHATV